MEEYSYFSLIAERILPVREIANLPSCRSSIIAMGEACEFLSNLVESYGYIQAPVQIDSFKGGAMFDMEIYDTFKKLYGRVTIYAFESSQVENYENHSMDESVK